MNNPYAPLFSNFGDRMVVLTAIVVVFISAAVAGSARTGIRIQNCYSAMSGALLGLSSAILFLYLLGTLGAYFRVTSGLWTFWELLFLLSVIAVFQVLPIFSGLLLLWGAVGRLCCSYSIRPLKLAIFATLLLGIDSGLYFLVQRLMASSAKSMG